VEVHELRGFVSNNLTSALNEVYAVSRGTKARQCLFSLSLNPPPSENVPTKDFEDAIERVEKKLGLVDQPRAIVFHEKNGRRHCHAVWSRIDAQAMKAIPLSFSNYTLMDVARDLFREHGWTMPKGLIDARQNDLKNFTLAQWQQAKRIGKDARAIKEVFQQCWAASDSQAAFRAALKDHGYILARGDRRGFVALDHACEVYAVARWVGIKTKDLASKLTDQNSLPSVDEAREQIAQTVSDRLTQLRAAQQTAIQTRLAMIETRRVQMAKAHAQARQALREEQEDRWQTETRARQARFAKGLRGWLEHLTGQHRRIRKQNEVETDQAAQRDRSEQDALIFRQLDERRALQARINRLRSYDQRRAESLSQDIDQYQAIQRHERTTFEHRPPAARSRSQAGPKHER
jgi:hypothetical protein